MRHGLLYIPALCLLSAIGMGGSSCAKRQTTEADSTCMAAPSPAKPALVAMQVSRQARLYTTEYQVHKIVTYSDDPVIKGTVFGAPIKMKARLGDRKVAIPISVTLKAYIDFADFSEKNVERRDSLLIITLPDPHIAATASRVDNRATRQYVDGLRSRFTDAEITGFARQGADSILSHASSLGIVEQAERSAAMQLLPLLQRMGYKEENVTIRFRKKFSDGELLKMTEKR